MMQYGRTVWKWGSRRRKNEKYRTRERRRSRTFKMSS